MDENRAKNEEKPTPEVKWATPVQRIWAWVGVVYMVILLLLSTFALSHGEYLRGIGGAMLSPALCGLGATMILRYRQGVARGGLINCVLLSGTCFALAVWNVIRSIPVLLEQL